MTSPAACVSKLPLLPPILGVTMHAHTIKKPSFYYNISDFITAASTVRKTELQNCYNVKYQTPFDALRYERTDGGGA